MSADRYVVIGLARVRAPWFAEVARWAHAASVPIEFVKCISPAEAHARLEAGRRVSALVLDAGAQGIDRDLIDRARHLGVASIIIDDPHVDKDWIALGATEVLDQHFERADLVAALAQHASPVPSVDAHSAAGLIEPEGEQPSRWQGRSIAVCGASGAGTSTLAMGLAQELASVPVNRGSVLLADLALRADMAMYHDTGDVVPGLQELVEAHQGGRPTASTIRRMLYDVESRGYLLLLGLRRSRDWTALRPRALEAALESLSSSFRFVVTDIDADFDGEDETGSIDVEERNAAARCAARRADVCVVVSTPTLVGIHSGLRIAGDLVELGVEPKRILQVVNRAPRTARARSEIVEVLAELAEPTIASAPVVFVAERRGLEAIHRGGGALPGGFASAPCRAVMAILGRDTGNADALDDPVGAAPVRHAIRRRSA